jgi:hypothetical protein
LYESKITIELVACIFCGFAALREIRLFVALTHGLSRREAHAKPQKRKTEKTPTGRIAGATYRVFFAALREREGATTGPSLTHVATPGLCVAELPEERLAQRRKAEKAPTERISGRGCTNRKSLSKWLPVFFASLRLCVRS